MAKDKEMKFGGWHLCPRCSRPVTNGERCSNCESKPDSSRLLTMVEMSKAITERRRILELNGHKPNTQDARFAVAQAQRDLTASETLKAVGEWLRNHGRLRAGYLDPLLDSYDYEKLYKALKQGRMPEGGRNERD